MSPTASPAKRARYLSRYVDSVATDVPTATAVAGALLDAVPAGVPYADAVPAASLKAPPVIAPAPAKPAAAKPSPSRADVLRGVGRTKVATSGVEVAGELKRLWDGGKGGGPEIGPGLRVLTYDTLRIRY